MKSNKLNHLVNLVLLSFVLISLSCEEVHENRYRIGFANCFDNDLWRKSMVNSMRVEAALNPEIDLEIFEADTDAKL